MTIIAREDEPLSTLIRQYIPKWEELDADTLSAQVYALAEKLKFQLYWWDTGDEPNWEPSLIKNPVTGYFDTYNTVRYLPKIAEFQLGGREYPEPINIGGGPLSKKELEALAELHRTDLPVTSPAYPIRYGTKEPGSQSVHTKGGFQQSEPLTDFLDRYIPDWRELSLRELGQEVGHLSTEMRFELIADVNSDNEYVEIDYTHPELVD